jgi:predicted enzyme related to lactoylglutathione lyase
MADKNIGAVCYLEIPAPDLDKAKRFYATVFEWVISDSDLGEAPYAVFQAGGLDGGLDSRTRPAENGILLYLKVRDIPSKLHEIEKEGGRCLTAKRRVIDGSDEFGFVAMFADPNGNRLGLWAKA